MNNPCTRLFHIGPQKAATTWFYACLKTHPQICTAARDTIHYYDMFYHKGPDWYESQFTVGDGPCLFDPTYTTIRAPGAARRIAADWPHARLIVTLRHPLERAFSHYWHERKKGTVRYDFAAILTNYDLFANWVQPGLYASMLRPFVDEFGAGAILPVKMEDIAADPAVCLERVYAHAGLDPVPPPPEAFRKINQSGARQTLPRRIALKAGEIVTGGRARESAFWRRLAGMERMEDVLSGPLRAELMTLIRPEIEETESMLHVDLSSWT